MESHLSAENAPIHGLVHVVPKEECPSGEARRS